MTRARFGLSADPLAALTAALLVAACGLIAVHPAQAAKPCWERVIDDWADNSRIDGVYSVACLDEALERVPEDIRVYGDFEAQIQQALQLAVARVPQGVKGASVEGTTLPIPEVEPETGSKDGPIDQLLGVDTNDARSFPIPLLVLTALAATLIAAGGAGLAKRKLRARRSAPR